MKEKGFTLIELLAVIVILAVIAVISTPLVMGIIEKSRVGAMEENRRVMEHAAELFSIDSKNESRLPHNRGDRVYVDLVDLEGTYMKPIAGYKEKCEGYVSIENVKDNYDYTAYLDCGSGNTLAIDSAYVNYGGRYLDEFTNHITTTDKGMVVVGKSNSPNYGKQKNKSSDISYDAVIVKYNEKGKMEWENHFGGSSNDEFVKVIEVSDGYLVLGNMDSKDGDLSKEKTYTKNVMLVKYNKSGKLVKQVLLTKGSSNTQGSNILLLGEHIYVVGGSRETPNGMQCAMVISLNMNLEIEWKKFYGGTYSSAFSGITKTSDNQLVVSGFSASIDGDMADMNPSEQGISDGIIYKINASTGAIMNKTLVKNRSFSYVTMVGENYFARSGGNIYIISLDGTIIKTKSAPRINSIDQVGTNTWVYSYWYHDSKREAHLAFITIDESLNTLKIKDYKTTNLAIVNSLVKLNNAYYVVGTNFSTSDIFEAFNYGNSDAFLMKLDTNLERLKDFKLQTILKQKLPDFVKNYGDHIPTPAERSKLKLYTTNDPTKDMKKWCTSDSYLDPNSNYIAPDCLKPFDNSQIQSIGSKTIFNIDTNIHIPVGTYQTTSWLAANFYFGNAGTGYELSNLKFTFSDGKTLTVEQAVKEGYLEPLVISGVINNGTYYFSNSYQLLSGGNSGLGNYPRYRLLIKPKNKKVTALSVTINKVPTAVSAHSSIEVSEYRDFDISVEAAKDE